MDELEREIADRLRLQADAAPEPPDLAEHILRRVSVRRRRRRRAEAIAVIIAVVAAIGAPAYVMAHRQHGEPAAAQPLASPTTAIMASPRGPSPGPHVPGPADPQEIPRRLPGGWLLSAYGVDSDGGVLGVGVRYGSNGTQQQDGRLWRIDEDDAAPAPIANPAGLWTAASGDGVLVWSEHRDSQHDFQLLCRSGGHARQLGEHGVARDPGGFHVDRGVVVWTDEGHRRVWTTKGCAGSPRMIDTAGYAVAFYYPHAYVVDAGVAGRIRQINVATGAVVSRALPESVTRDGTVLFAAGPRTLSYSDGHELVVIDTSTWQPRTVSTRLPHSTGLNGEEVTLTAGDDAVVYSTRPLDGDPKADQAVVYLTSRPQIRMLAGEAYAKGRWLVWRDDDVYRRQDPPPPRPRDACGACRHRLDGGTGPQR
jgi:hypothetical protein